MGGPQIVMWPIEDEYSWYPDLGEAIAAASGDTFDYKLCVERAPDTMDATGLEDWLRESLGVSINSYDGEAESRIVTSEPVQAALHSLALVLSIEAERNKLWFPVGEVLTYAAEDEGE